MNKSTPMRKVLFSAHPFFFSLLFLAFSTAVFSQKTWTGATDSNWNEGSNWSPTGVPGAADDIIIPDVANDPVATGIEINIASGITMTVEAGAVLTIDGQNAVADGIHNLGTVTNNGTIDISNTTDDAIQTQGMLTNGSGGGIIINGTTFGIYLTFSGSVSNSGTIKIGENAGIIQWAIATATGVPFTNEACGLIHIFSDNFLGDFGNNFTNNGTVISNYTGTNTISGVETNNGIVHNLGGGTFTIVNQNGILTDNAAKVFWTGCVDTDWMNPTNWHDQQIPVASSQVEILMAANQPELASPSGVAETVILNPNTSLTIQNGGTLLVDAFSNTDNAEKFRLNSNALLTIEAGGVLTVRNSNWDGILNSGGTITNSGILNVTIAVFRAINNNAGVLTNNIGGTINVSGADAGIRNFDSFTNYGSINIDNPGGGIFNDGGTLVNESCASIQTNPTILDSGNSFTNNGVIVENSANDSDIEINNGTVYNLNGGTFTVTMGNAPLTALPTGTFTWTGAADNNWSNPCNWDSGIAPSGMEDIIIPATPNDPVATGIQITIATGKTMIIEAGAVLTIDGENMNIDGIRNNGSIDNHGTIDIRAVNNNAIAARGIFNNHSSGTVKLNYGCNGIDVSNSGSVINDGRIEIGEFVPCVCAAIVVGNGTFNNNSCGLVHVFGDEPIYDFDSGAGFTNDGTIIANYTTPSTSPDLGISTNNGIVYNLGGGAFNIGGGTGTILTTLPTTNTWTGSTDANWFNGCNWDSGTRPLAEQEVVIPSGTPNSPEINDPGAVARKVTVDDGAQLLVLDGGDLTLNGQQTVDYCLHNSGYIRIDGDGTVTLDSANADGIVNTGFGVLQNFGTVDIGGISANGCIGNAGLWCNSNDNFFLNLGILNIKGTGCINPGSGRGIAVSAGLCQNEEGTINIDGTAADGIWVINSGTFLNLSNTLNIGLNGAIGGNGIYNENNFVNNAEINIQQTGVDGIQNNGGTFTNEGGTINLDDITNSAVSTPSGSIVNNNSGIINIGLTGTVGENGVYNAGTFQNFAAMNIEGAGFDGIINTNSGNFENNGGTVNVTNSGGSNIANLGAGSQFTNSGVIDLNTVGFHGITNDAATFQNFAEINIQNATQDGIQNRNGGIFNNNGGILSIANTGFSNIAILNPTTSFTNSNSGQVSLDGATGSGIYNEGNLLNETNGSINVTNANEQDLFLQFTATFTNSNCSSFLGTDDVRIDAGTTLTNTGLVSCASMALTGTFDNTNGYVYDVSTAFDCVSNGGTCLASPLTHIQFISDNDNDGTGFCEGDTDDLNCSTSTTHLVSNTMDNGVGSLRWAIACAVTGDTIIFAPATDGQMIQLSSGQIVIDKDLTLIGNGMDVTIIDGSLDDANRIFQVSSGANVKFSGITFQNGGSATFSNAGGCMEISGNSSLQALACRFASNRSSILGGVFFIGGGALTTTNCIMHDNSADAAGVAWSQGTSAISIDQCLIYSNEVSNNLGVFAFLSGATAAIRQSTIAGNDANGTPAIMTQVDLSLYNNIITDNNGEDVGIQAAGTVTAFNNLIGSGITPGTNGNITGDPLFVDAANGDFHLQAGSPCANTGDNVHLPVDACDVDGDGNTAEQIDIDLDRTVRVIEATVDMGVFESCFLPANAIVYVDINAAGANNGTNWADAFISLESALNVADCAPYSTQIWVADGIYKPSKMLDLDGNGTLETREVTFSIPDKAQLYGGFAGGETDLSERNWAANPAILSGDIDNNDTQTPAQTPADLLGSNAYHIVSTRYVSDSTVVDGFTISGGLSNTTGLHRFGAGLFNQGNGPGNSSSPQIANCTFTGNRADQVGGAILNWGESQGSSKANFSNCLFSGNTAGRGGAIYNAGAISGDCSPCISNCIFLSNNSTGFGGGAIFNDGGTAGTCNPSIVNCHFENNSGGVGGAILNNGLFEGNSNPIIANSTFVANSASDGGAMYNNGDSGTGSPSGNSSPLISNCTFYNNSATGNGGAIMNDAWNNGNSSPNISNSIFWGNTAGGMGNTMYSDLGTPILGGVANPVMTNCLVEDAACPDDGSGTATCNGTMLYAQDPLFADAGNGFFQLSAGSPALNAGDNAFVAADTCDLDGDDDRVEPSPFDLAGLARVENGVVDMGAYEGFATKITFRVDMTKELPIAPEGVFVAGNFQSEAGFGGDWIPDITPMLDPDGDNIFEVTINLFNTGLESFEYKFLNGPAGWENVPMECGINTTGFYNRGFTSVADSLTLPIVCFNECGPCNDMCSMATTIACGETVMGSTTDATNELGLTCIFDLGDAGGAWYKLTGNGGVTTVSLEGSDYDTQLGIFTGDCNSLNCLVGNDDFNSLQSKLSFDSEAGIDYFIYVTGFALSEGNFQLSLTCGPECPADLVLDNSFGWLGGTFEAANSITLSNTFLLDQSSVILSAPAVNLPQNVDVFLGGVLETNSTGCVPVP